MKKRIAGILTAALIGTTVMGTVAMAAPSGAIDVISREDGSGTRGAFVELFGIEEEKDGEKVDSATSSLTFIRFSKRRTISLSISSISSLYLSKSVIGFLRYVS